MKKLMVILAGALICSVASAGTVRWTGSETFSDSTGAEYDGDIRNPMAYLFDTATVTQQALFESWAGGSVDLSGAKVSETWYDAYQLDVTAQIGDSGTKNLFWAVVEGDDLFISSAIEKTVSGMGVTEFAWSDESGNVFADATSFGGAGWYTASAIPEPTSGLLMLLGMAGLALRRRRA